MRRVHTTTILIAFGIAVDVVLGVGIWGFERGWIRTDPPKFLVIVLLYAANAAIFVPLTIHALQGHRRSMFQIAGRCQTCGYDLRASTDRCPECGSVIR